jgi:hypothetical protein
MHKHENEFRIATMCRLLTVSRSASYQWRSQQSGLSERQQERERLERRGFPR